MFIVATVGQSMTKQQLTKIILSGADILRFNFSRHTTEKNIGLIKKTKQVVDELNSSEKILIDFPTNKARIGNFDAQMLAVQEHQELVFHSSDYSPDLNEFIPVKISHLGEKVKINQMMTIGDGEIAIQVNEILSSETIKATVLNNGILRYMKLFNIGYKNKNETMEKIYKETYQQILPLSPAYLSVSYIDNSFIKNIKEIFGHKNKHCNLILKIEEDIADDEIEKICQDDYFDIIMVDRGEIGINSPFEKTGILQKRILNIAHKYSKPVFVSTQILLSTINNYIPNRSDISDLTNMVMDGVSGIIFSYEIGTSKRPAYTITTAKKIISETEKFKNAK